MWSSGGTLFAPSLFYQTGATMTMSGRLSINGQIAIMDGTQRNGYVLTSDANGLASWRRSLEPCIPGGTAAGVMGVGNTCYGTGATPLQLQPTGSYNTAIGSNTMVANR